MTDIEVLIEKTNHIQNCLKRIHDTLKGDLNRLDNLDVQDIIVLNLQRSVQLVLDMASHIVSTEQLGHSPVSKGIIYNSGEKWGA